ncbi:hypothetical protein MAHJHV59_50420 [Mycobacterium avium subsp. hominissuis]
MGILIQLARQRGVVAMHGRPALGAVAGEGRHAALPRAVHDAGGRYGLVGILIQLARPAARRR